MWPDFPASDYYGGSVSLHIIGDPLPFHLCKPSPVHMLDSSHGRGCLSQSFALLAASRRKHHGLATRSPWLPADRHIYPFGIRVVTHPTYVGRQFASCLLSDVGRGDLSTLRCVFTDSCSSTVPCSAWRLILADRKSTRLNSSHLGISY